MESPSDQSTVCLTNRDRADSESDVQATANENSKTKTSWFPIQYQIKDNILNENTLHSNKICFEFKHTALI